MAAHDWQLAGGTKENPGVFSLGGGVRVVSVCRDCGALRHEESWDVTQNRPLPNGQWRVAYSRTVGANTYAVESEPPCVDVDGDGAWRVPAARTA